ncbi:hypothetical protein Tco_0895760 [Tanacetum coccineum]|uniref:Uncharacterized protein n=1 Tax=Tanacetum coccineum TaxID=301880 RepID=A0ABQ5CGL7_9ASTR
MKTPESPHTLASTHFTSGISISPTVMLRSQRIIDTYITKVATSLDSTFCKRFRSSYETSPSSSPPELPLQKRSRGTSEFVEDDEVEDEDEEVEESLDFDSESEDAGGDTWVLLRDEESCYRGIGLWGVETSRDALWEGRCLVYSRLGLTVDVPAYPTTHHLSSDTCTSPECRSNSLPISLTPSIDLTYFITPDTLIVPSLVASPAMAETEIFLTELGAQVEIQEGLIHDHIVRLGSFILTFCFERYDRDIGEFFTSPGVHRQVSLDTHKSALWHAISDTAMENWGVALQITEERHARLGFLAEFVASMRRRAEPMRRSVDVWI